MLHELTHWALGIDSGLPHHGRTFARVLLDATGEFCGADRARRSGDVVPRARRARRPPAARRARRPAPVRLGRAPPPRARAGPARVDCTTPDGEGPSSSPGRFEGYERGSSVVRLSCGRRHDHARRDQRRCGTCAMLIEGTRRAIFAAFLANLGIAISKFAAFADHRLGVDARRGDPLGRRHRQPGPAVPRRHAEPARSRPPSTRSGSARALLLGVRRGAGAVHARLAVRARTRASRSSSIPSTSSRRSGRTSCSAWRSCSRAARCAPRDREATAVARGPLVVAASSAPPRAPSSPSCCSRTPARSSVCFIALDRHHAWPRSPATRAGTRSGSIGIGLLLGVIAVVLAIEMKSLLIGEAVAPAGRRADPRRDPRRPRGVADHPPAHACTSVPTTCSLAAKLEFTCDDDARARATRSTPSRRACEPRCRSSDSSSSSPTSTDATRRREHRSDGYRGGTDRRRHRRQPSIASTKRSTVTTSTR